jgi:signal transduction histidine kinase
MAHASSRPHGGLRIALGAGLLLISGLLLARAVGAWPGDAIVWPAAVAVVGALVIWRAPSAAPQRRAGWAAHRPHARSTAEKSSVAAAERSSVGDQLARAQALGRPEVSRTGLGVTLVLLAGFAFMWANGATRPAGEALLAAFAALLALALIFAPSWRRLARSLKAEQAERIRSQERADVGAHLHDSVLQTLALIQRSAEDPNQVATLARSQERELRAWLAEGEPRKAGAQLGAALQAAAAEVEAAAGGRVELVAVGDCPLQDDGAAVVAAAREAMLNAVKFAGGQPVSVYAELSEERIEVFVRDRGSGFDLKDVPPARRGVRESILGRMRRAGGSAVVHAAPGRGTEVALTLDRRGRT